MSQDAPIQMVLSSARAKMATSSILMDEPASVGACSLQIAAVSQLLIGQSDTLIKTLSASGQ